MSRERDPAHEAMLKGVHLAYKRWKHLKNTLPKSNPKIAEAKRAYVEQDDATRAYLILSRGVEPAHRRESW